MNLSQIKIVAPDYDENEFFDIAKGNEHLPEGGARCKDCYRLRLEKTAEYAKKGGFDYFTTTLSVSPYKNAQALNEIGSELSEKYGVKYENGVLGVKNNRPLNPNTSYLIIN